MAAPKEKERAKGTNRYCCVYGCLNSTKIKPDISFFSLPNDNERRSKWLHLISREELFNKQAGSYHVCEEHFNVHDILQNSNRKKLRCSALPSLYLPLLNKKEEGTQTQVLTHEEKCEQTEYVSVTDKTTQTNKSLMSDFPQKRKLKLELSECRKKIKTYEIDSQTGKQQKIIFRKLCDKFLTKELAELCKGQTFLKLHNPGNRYNQDYISFCLNLYNTSPKAYHLLQRALCLPSPQTLKRQFKQTAAAENGSSLVKATQTTTQTKIEQ